MKRDFKAERSIKSCDHCNKEDAEIPFNNILDRVTGSDPRVMDHLLEARAKCPNCRREILEKTLIELSEAPRMRSSRDHKRTLRYSDDSRQLFSCVRRPTRLRKLSKPFTAQ